MNPTGTIPYLDPEKSAAVLTTEGPVLVIAGPGSGKTRTLVERTARLVQSGIAPSNILVGTFTERAASELITRISNRLLELELKVNLNEMWVGTLHSLFLRILEDHREFTRLKRNYRVLDQFDQRYYIYRRIKEFHASPHSSRLLNPATTNGWTQAETVVAYVNKISEELLDPDALKADPDEAIAAVGHLYETYRRVSGEDNLLDFSSIQVEAHNLLAERPEVLAALQVRLRYLMIDEYQDTNTVQEKILLKLAAKHSNLCVVGDDDQGLYRFRGATIRNILEFPQNFPPGTCKTFRLTTNYRSHPGIIRFYNEWMRHLDWQGDDGTQFRFDKEIKPRSGTFPDTAAVVRVTTDGTQDAWNHRPHPRRGRYWICPASAPAR